MFHAGFFGVINLRLYENVSACAGRVSSQPNHCQDAQHLQISGVGKFRGRVHGEEAKDTIQQFGHACGFGDEGIRTGMQA